MATKNFTNFNLSTSPLTGDYIVGYCQDGSAELRTAVSDLGNTLKTLPGFSVYATGGGCNSIIPVAGDNVVSGDNSVIGGGGGNNICSFPIEYATIGGGSVNVIASGFGSTVGGGEGNCVTTGSHVTIAGGCANTASGDYAFIGGGEANCIYGAADHSVIGGGSSNQIDNSSNVIAGGGGNCILGSDTNNAIGGGINNTISGYNGVNTIGGGYVNRICSLDGGGSTIVGGFCNTASNYSSIGGGSFNAAYNSSSIGGGRVNTACNCSSIGGGCCNSALGTFTNINGGSNNLINANNSFIAGGSANKTFYDNTFLLGSTLSASQANFTYVNNLSSQGIINTGSLTTGSSVTTFNNNPFTIVATASGSVYESLQNTVAGVSASTDISIYNDLGTIYVDMGINSSKYNGNIYSPKFNVVGPNDSYFYSTSANLAHGTAGSVGDLIFFTGGSLSGTSVNNGNERLRIKNTNTSGNGGFIGINTATPNTQLTISGSVSSTGFIASSALRVIDGVYPTTLTNTTMGSGTLVTNASATIATTAVTNNSRIFITIQNPIGSIGTPFVASRIATTSFTVSSTNINDRSGFAWLLVEPA